MKIVKGAGGIDIAVYEAGNPQGPALLFIHGFSQAALSWKKQFESDLAKTYRLVALDMRGHGASGKPMEPSAYDHAKPFAGDIQAVLDGLGLDKVVAVCWSMGGNWICDYLRVCGDSRLRGIILVDAPTQQGTEITEKMFGGAVGDTLGDMFSTEPAANIRGTKGFVRACTAKPLPEAEFEDMLAFNMMVPPQAREWMLSRVVDNNDVVGKITVPVLQIHGAADGVVLPFAGEYTLEHVNHDDKKMIVYDGVGHCPFWENAERFNADVAAFVEGLDG